MLRDPMEVFAATATATASFLPPGGHPTKPKHPVDTTFPTVVPDPPHYEHATAAGVRTLWVVFVLMLIASLTFIALGWALPASRRLFHQITATITIIATLSYFAMATHSGITWHHTRVRERHDTVPDTFQHIIREVYWARYVDWLLTTPLLLLDLAILSGLSGAQIFTTITADVIMILSGLFAAFGHRGSQKWGWYAFACIAYIVIIYQVLFNGRTFANARGNRIAKFYYSIAGYTLIVWTAYPIIWALGDGKRILTVNQEIIAYAVLDVLAKGVFGAWLLFAHRSLPEADVAIEGFWVHGFASEGAIRIEEEGA